MYEGEAERTVEGAAGTGMGEFAEDYIDLEETK